MFPNFLYFDGVFNGAFELGSWWWVVVAMLSIFVGWHKEIFGWIPRKLHAGHPLVKAWFIIRHPWNKKKREDAEFYYGYDLEGEE